MSASPPILQLTDVHVSFDGFKALNGLSLSIQPGELRCLIGPNGAGKTTLMDVITGRTRPERGAALLEGRVDLTCLDETRIARAGVGRKFQRPSVLEGHSVYENLELALKSDRGILASLLRPLDAGQRARLEATLRRIDLVREAHRPAGTLSHGQKQWLEIGMLLVQEPKLLLLDEPVAGMTDEETARTAGLLRQLAGDHTVVVVEHDMEFVQSIAQTVTVLHEGAVLAEGPMEAMQRDPRVIEVYLGR